MQKHKWNKSSQDLKNPYTEQHQCLVCGIYRIKILGFWRYSKEKTTQQNPFVKTSDNPGCIKQKSKR